MKILLVCNAGMSTSMLVSKMEAAASNKGIDLEIAAMPYTQAANVINDWDIVMLGPQVRHILKNIQKNSNGTPIVVIDMRDYGLMNGEGVLNQALKALGK